MDWAGKKEAANITVSSITLVAEEGKALRDRILSGLSGGVGFFEGEPYRIEIGPLNTQTSFDGYLDFSAGVNFVDACEVECTLKREQGSDWLNEVANGFSYRYLQNQGIISDTDFVSVPMVINYIPSAASLLILSISTFIMTKELVESIQAIADRIADLVDAATPVVTVPPGIDVGNIIMAALKLVAQIAYTAAIVVALVKLTESIIEQLLPPKRYHKGMTVKNLFVKACQYLNLTLESTLLDEIDKGGNKWVLLPSKNHRGGEKPTGADASWRETGVPSQQDATDTFAGVIRTFKDMFNADFQLKDGVFIFERRDFFVKSTGYVIPDTFIDQEKLIDSNTFNTDELKSSYNINWSFDSQDLNTLDNQNGRVFQAVLSPKVTNNPKLKSLTGLQEVGIPITMGLRKDKLTIIEEIVRALVSVVDALTGQLGQPQSLSALITNRIGALSSSSHFLSSPKMVVMAGSNLQLDQRNIISAGNLWNNYHYINSFKQINGKHNQYWIYREQKIPFCFEDFVNLLDSNQVETVQGEPADIESLEWDIWNNFATINYRVNRLYDDNFNITFL
tara:strand:+ start:8 stop:1702 length:1695 start_codon:yes stop_codon:yes gene_type:complete